MAFIGVRISHDIGRLISQIDVPGDKVPVSEMHITMLYFGDEWPISELAKAMEPAFDVISKTKPFLAKINTITHFPKGPHSENGFPIIARVESKELHNLRDKLAKRFDKDKIQFSKLHPEYKPHITLSYAPDKPKDIKIDNLEFAITEVILWGGDHGDDRIFITFPMVGPDKTKSSLLLQKSSVFQKLSMNSGSNYLKSTLK